MFCTKCGAKTSDEMKFCSICGNATSGDSQKTTIEDKKEDIEVTVLHVVRRQGVVQIFLGVGVIIIVGIIAAVTGWAFIGLGIFLGIAPIINGLRALFTRKKNAIAVYKELEQSGEVKQTS